MTEQPIKVLEAVFGFLCGFLSRVGQANPWEPLSPLRTVRATFMAHGSPPYIRRRDSIPLPPVFESFAIPHCLCLIADHILVAHTITACTLGTMGTPLPYRSPSLSIDLLQAI